MRKAEKILSSVMNEEKLELLKEFSKFEERLERKKMRLGFFEQLHLIDYLIFRNNKARKDDIAVLIFRKNKRGKT